MNIFYLDTDPRRAAEAHCDAHVVKMILETAQILSTVWHKSGLTVPYGLYKATHSNHPCVLWSEASNSNYGWLAQLGFALCNEYTYRYGKTHKSENVLYIAEEPPYTIPNQPLTPVALAMPDEVIIGDGVEAYREYYGYKARTMHRFSYTKRDEPTWL